MLVYIAPFQSMNMMMIRVVKAVVVWNQGGHLVLLSELGLFLMTFTP